jgi:hypothetical protein
MPPKKRLGKELPVEGSSQAAGEQVPTTTHTIIQTTHIPQIVHPQPSTEFHTATTEARRPKDLVEQPTTQAEVLAMNTSPQNTMPAPPHQHQTIKTQEGLQQDSEEEIEAVIKDDLVCLHQENECLRLMQEHLARRKAMVKRSQIMQQQIKKERATQVELQ